MADIKQENIETVSEILNDTGAYNKILKAFGIEDAHDSPKFQEIKEED
jgi:hypothetical protein